MEHNMHSNSFMLHKVSKGWNIHICSWKMIDNENDDDSIKNNSCENCR